MVRRMFRAGQGLVLKALELQHEYRAVWGPWTTRNVNNQGSCVVCCLHVAFPCLAASGVQLLCSQPCSPEVRTEVHAEECLGVLQRWAAWMCGGCGSGCSFKSAFGPNDATESNACAGRRARSVQVLMRGFSGYEGISGNEGFAVLTQAATCLKGTPGYLCLSHETSASIESWGAGWSTSAGQ